MWIWFEEYPALWISAGAILGLIVGSFLNVVIIRLPRRMMFLWRQQCQEYLEIQESAAQSTPPGIVFESSHCVICKNTLSAWENIPVISYLVLRGRCRHCGTAISWRYPLVELITAILTALVAWNLGPGLALAGALVFTWCLIALAGIDIEHQLLPDQITLPLLWLGLLLNLETTYAPLSDAVIGAASGYLILWSVFHAFRLLSGKEGMGYGDFKLTAALGAWLGWQMIPIIILAASLTGSLVGLALIAFGKHQREVPIPFGPYLAMGGFIALLWGQQILDQYFNAFAP